ncbi:MAG: hypothetical protein QOJ29_2332 [Thermoleophilaceae bacterium]|nr:hypothetical protein [Thermoleophilaceae bacterium]
MTAETTFGGLTPDAWDALASDRFYSTSAWLRFCTAEAESPGSAVVSFRDTGPACAVPVRELQGLPAWSRYRWNDHLREGGLPQMAPGGTLVGPPEGFQTHLLGPGGEPSIAAVEDLVSSLRRRSSSADGVEQRPCVAMFLTTPDVVRLRAAGVTTEPVILDADAWIPLPEGGWPAWLESLSGNRRKTVRREDRRFREAGYAVTHMPLAECVEQLGDLAASTLAKYGHSTTPENELRSLRRVVDCLDERATVAVCSLPDGELLGFCLYYLWGDSLFPRWVGFDYDRLLGTAEYFNLAYYSLVKLADEHGVRRLHVGVGSPEAKALRGAQLQPLWMVDLTEDSVLATVPEQIRAHNAGVYHRFADNTSTAGALVDRDAWCGDLGP